MTTELVAAAEAAEAAAVRAAEAVAKAEAAEETRRRLSEEAADAVAAAGISAVIGAAVEEHLDSREASIGGVLRR